MALTVKIPSTSQPGQRINDNSKSKHRLKRIRSKRFRVASMKHRVRQVKKSETNLNPRIHSMVVSPDEWDNTSDGDLVTKRLSEIEPDNSAISNENGQNINMDSQDENENSTDTERQEKDHRSDTPDDLEKSSSESDTSNKQINGNSSDNESQKEDGESSPTSPFPEEKGDTSSTGSDCSDSDKPKARSLEIERRRNLKSPELLKSLRGGQQKKFTTPKVVLYSKASKSKLVKKRSTERPQIIEGDTNDDNICKGDRDGDSMHSGSSDEHSGDLRGRGTRQIQSEVPVEELKYAKRGNQKGSTEVDDSPDSIRKPDQSVDESDGKKVESSNCTTPKEGIPGNVTKFHKKKPGVNKRVKLKIDVDKKKDVEQNVSPLTGFSSKSKIPKKKTKSQMLEGKSSQNLHIEPQSGSDVEDCESGLAKCANISSTATQITKDVTKKSRVESPKPEAISKQSGSDVEDRGSGFAKCTNISATATTITKGVTKKSRLESPKPEAIRSQSGSDVEDCGSGFVKCTNISATATTTITKGVTKKSWLESPKPEAIRSQSGSDVEDCGSGFAKCTNISATATTITKGFSKKSRLESPKPEAFRSQSGSDVEDCGSGFAKCTNISATATTITKGVTNKSRLESPKPDAISSQSGSDVEDCGCDFAKCINISATATPIMKDVATKSRLESPKSEAIRTHSGSDVEECGSDFAKCTNILATACPITKDVTSSKDNKKKSQLESPKSDAIRTRSRSRFSSNTPEKLANKSRTGNKSEVQPMNDNQCQIMLDHENGGECITMKLPSPSIDYSRKMGRTFLNDELLPPKTPESSRTRTKQNDSCGSADRPSIEKLSEIVDRSIPYHPVHQDLDVTGNPKTSLKILTDTLNVVGHPPSRSLKKKKVKVHNRLEKLDSTKGTSGTLPVKDHDCVQRVKDSAFDSRDLADRQSSEKSSKSLHRTVSSSRVRDQKNVTCNLKTSLKLSTDTSIGVGRLSTGSPSTKKVKVHNRNGKRKSTKGTSDTLPVKDYDCGQRVNVSVHNTVIPAASHSFDDTSDSESMTVRSQFTESLPGDPIKKLSDSSELPIPDVGDGSIVTSGSSVDEDNNLVDPRCNLKRRTESSEESPFAKIRKSCFERFQGSTVDQRGAESINYHKPRIECETWKKSSDDLVNSLGLSPRRTIRKTHRRNSQQTVTDNNQFDWDVGALDYEYVPDVAPDSLEESPVPESGKLKSQHMQESTSSSPTTKFSGYGRSSNRLETVRDTKRPEVVTWSPMKDMPDGNLNDVDSGRQNELENHTLQQTLSPEVHLAPGEFYVDWNKPTYFNEKNSFGVHYDDPSAFRKALDWTNHLYRMVQKTPTSILKKKKSQIESRVRNAVSQVKTFDAISTAPALMMKESTVETIKNLICPKYWEGELCQDKNCRKKHKINCDEFPSVTPDEVFRAVSARLFELDKLPPDMASSMIEWLSYRNESIKILSFSKILLTNKGLNCCINLCSVIIKHLAKVFDWEPASMVEFFLKFHYLMVRKDPSPTTIKSVMYKLIEYTQVGIYRLKVFNIVRFLLDVEGFKLPFGILDKLLHEVINEPPIDITEVKDKIKSQLKSFHKIEDQNFRARAYRFLQVYFPDTFKK